MVDIGYNLEGLFIKDRLVTNYIPMVRVVYAPPDAPADQISVLDCCLRFENGNSNLISLPFSSHLAVDISRLCPSAVLFRQSAASAVQQFIVQQLQGLEVIKDPLTQQPIHIGRGLLLAGMGLIIFQPVKDCPSGTIVLPEAILPRFHFESLTSLMWSFWKEFRNRFKRCVRQ